jgi:uncharacterized protein YndB with AHSA1/START domain
MSKADHERIEKKMLLRAPRSKVWRALTRAEEFSTWFRIKMEGDFEVGKVIVGHSMMPGYEHLTMEVTIERMEAERFFSYRWHPYAIDPNVDYSKEPTTLVEFRLEDADGGTLLTVTESGFERIPEARRAEAFKMNSHGWGAQLDNIKCHVAG